MLGHSMNKVKSMSNIQKFRVRDGGDVPPAQSLPRTANEKLKLTVLKSFFKPFNAQYQ